MARTLPQTEPEARVLSLTQAQAFFDAQAQALLGISGAEFLRRLDAGEYANVPDDAAHADVMYLATLQSVGRRLP